MIHIVPMNWINMKEVFSEIEIQAPAGRVWQVLTDFANYSEWNPFIRRISGHPKEGKRLKVYIEPLGAKARASVVRTATDTWII